MELLEIMVHLGRALLPALAPQVQVQLELQEVVALMGPPEEAVMLLGHRVEQVVLKEAETIAHPAALPEVNQVTAMDHQAALLAIFRDLHLVLVE